MGYSAVHPSPDSVASNNKNKVKISYIHSSVLSIYITVTHNVVEIVVKHQNTEYLFTGPDVAGITNHDKLG